MWDVGNGRHVRRDVFADFASGDTFPIGTTTVTVTATDLSSNTTTKTFTITVVNTKAPVLTVVSNDVIAEATNAISREAPEIEKFNVVPKTCVAEVPCEGDDAIA